MTSARKPVALGECLAPGAHINAVGAFTPATRELDTAAVGKARLCVDRRQSTPNEVGEFIIATAEGAFGNDHIVDEIGDRLLGKIPDRGSATEIIRLKSLGIAIEDLAAAHHIWRKAEATGAGTWVEIGGRHYASM